MKHLTLQEHYNLIKEGKGNKNMFMMKSKRQYPNHIRNAASFEETVISLKQNHIIHEGFVEPKLPEKNTYFDTFSKLSGIKGVRPGIFENLKTFKKLNESKKETVSQHVKDVEKNTKELVTNPTPPKNLSGQGFIDGMNYEGNVIKNKDKTEDELIDIVIKNLTKDPLFYIKNFMFGWEGIGFTDEAPGLKASDPIKGKYVSSGYGDIGTLRVVETLELLKSYPKHLKKQFLKENVDMMGLGDLDGNSRMGNRDTSREENSYSPNFPEEDFSEMEIQNLLDKYNVDADWFVNVIMVDGLTSKELKDLDYLEDRIQSHLSMQGANAHTPEDDALNFIGDEAEDINESFSLKKVLRKLGWAGETWTPEEFASQIKSLDNETLISWGESNKGIPNTPLDFQHKLIKIEIEKRKLNENKKNMISLVKLFESEDEKYYMSHLKKEKAPKKEKKETAEDRIKNIEKQGNIAALEAKIEALDNEIKTRKGLIANVTEDEDIADFVNPAHVKEVEKEIKTLEKTKEKYIKQYEKMADETYKAPEPVIDDEEQDLGGGEEEFTDDEKDDIIVDLEGDEDVEEEDEIEENIHNTHPGRGVQDTGSTAGHSSVHIDDREKTDPDKYKFKSKPLPKDPIKEGWNSFLKGKKKIQPLNENREQASEINAYFKGKEKRSGGMFIGYYANSQGGKIMLEVSVEGKRGYPRDADKLAMRSKPMLPNGYFYVTGKPLTYDGDEMTLQTIKDADDMYSGRDYQGSEFSGGAYFEVEKR